jgi:ABC-type phosphate/phosphonate transport system substrate-binding protein
MSAALPWYDWPEVRASTDAFWKGLRRALDRQGIAAPERLQRLRPVAGLWHDPGLLLAQTCGYLFAAELRESVRLVATPAYDVEGCAGANYSSAVVVRANDPALTLGDLAGRRAAYNGRDSQSGYGALRATIATVAQRGRFFAATLKTGAHARSLEAIAAGEADCAAIDALCWAFVRRYRPALARALRVIAWTP